MYNEARKNYGEKYSDETFKKWTEETTYKGFEGFYAGENNTATVDNT